MNDNLVIIGVTCVIAAIVGGGLKVLGIEVPLLQSSRRQWALAGFGVLLIFVGFVGKPSLLPPPSVGDTPLLSRQSYTRENINTALGAGNWECFPDRLDGVLLINVPDNFVVTHPIAEVDKQGVKYKDGQTVPSGGNATAWLKGTLSDRQTQCPNP